MIHLSRLAAVMTLALLPCAPAFAAILINDVTVIDGTGRPEVPHQYVLIDGDRIVAIKDHAITMSAGVTAIDGHGKFLMPGMADTHIHLDGGRAGPDGKGMDKDTGRRLLQGYLYDGVTFVYDAANYDKYIFAMRDDERSGRMISPRIFATGYPMAWTGGYGSGGAGPTLSTYEEGVKAMDPLLAEKPDLIKFLYAPYVLNATTPIPAFDLTVMHRLIMYANERGFRTTIHAVEATTQRAAIEAGINALAHPVYMTETDDKLAPLIATRGIPVTTTLVVISNIFDLVDHPDHFESPGFRALMSDKDLAHLRDADRARYMKTHLDVWARQAYARGAVNVKKLYDAGAILTSGTDRTVGEYLPEELEILASLGIPPIQVLKMATLNSAIYLHTEDRMGSIQEGKLADLVLLNADPSQDIHHVRDISAVILGGKVIDRTKLELPVNHLAK